MWLMDFRPHLTFFSLFSLWSFTRVGSSWLIKPFIPEEQLNTYLDFFRNQGFLGCGKHLFKPKQRHGVNLAFRFLFFLFFGFFKDKVRSQLTTQSVFKRNCNNTHQKSMGKCTRQAQYRTSKIELLCKIESYNAEKCSVGHTRPIYTLAAKPLKI